MLRQVRPALVSVSVFMALLGVVFPGAITAVSQLAFRRQANGSLIEREGRIVGSELLGQSFSTPGYFHPRPSAAGGGYDAAASAGSNLGPTSRKLIDGIRDLAAAYREENGLGKDAPVPADAVTRSGSGLDPDISPANADAQVKRVAKTRGLPEETVRSLVAKFTRGRQLGVLGEPRVNVLLLNLSLDREAKLRG
jgi:potassium-transporting ATPase KdpC subunit